MTISAQVRKAAPSRRGTGAQVIKSFAAAAAASAIALSSFGLASAADKGIQIELNNAKVMDAGCRMSFVMENKLPHRIEELTFEIVLFDAAGSVSQFLALNAGSLPAGKMRVLQFDLKQHACTDISKILVNDVKTCKGAGLNANACLDLIAPTSSTSIKLVM